jgi:hypothetical protein
MHFTVYIDRHIYRYCISYLAVETIVKGSVQRKLRWVESGVIEWVWAWIFFVILGDLHLVLTFFPFVYLGILCCVFFSSFLGDLLCK